MQLDEAGAGLIKGLLDELKANGSLIIIADATTQKNLTIFQMRYTKSMTAKSQVI